MTTKKKYDVIGYGIGSFDDNLCLKPPLLLIAIAVFLSRDYILPLVMALMVKASSSEVLPWSAADRAPFWYLYGAPSVLVLYGWARRVSGGDFFARWTWLQGRWLLIAAAVMQGFSIIHEQGIGLTVWHSGSWTTVPMLLTMGFIILYLFFDRRAKDALSDFPERPAQAVRGAD